MNQFVQQSPRESNFEYEEQPHQQLHKTRQALSIITNVRNGYIQIQVLVAIFQIFLILFNSYIAFNLSYKITLLYVTILHFLHIIRIGVYNNKYFIILIRKIQRQLQCCVRIFWGILIISYYVITVIMQGCLIYFIENNEFPIQYPALMNVIFTLLWYVQTLYWYSKNKTEKNLTSSIMVFIRLLFTVQLALINLKQIQWVNWEWMFIFTIFWCFLAIVCVSQIIFLFDFVCKATSFMHESDPIVRESLNQQSSLWINLLILCLSGVPAFSMICYCIQLTTKQDSYNSMSITLSVLYSLVFIVYTLYYRITIRQSHQYVSQFVIYIQNYRNPQMSMNTNRNEPYQLNSPSSKHRNNLISNKEQLLTQLPQILIKLSSTYFLPLEQDNQPPNNPETKRYKVRTECELPKQSNRNSMTEINSEKDAQCFNCYQNECCAVYMPCGHGGLCIKCATDWFTEKQECLICRKPVESVVKVSQIELNKVKVVDVLAY